jgi:hypothetical protein
VFQEQEQKDHMASSKLHKTEVHTHYRTPEKRIYELRLWVYLVFTCVAYYGGSKMA